MLIKDSLMIMKNISGDNQFKVFLLPEFKLSVSTRKATPFLSPLQMTMNLYFVIH